MKGTLIVKKILLPLIMLLGGLLVGLALPAEWREKLSRPLAAALGGMVAHMPDE